MKERLLPVAMGAVLGSIAGFFAPELAYQFALGSNWPNGLIDFFRGQTENTIVEGLSAVLGGVCVGGLVHFWISEQRREQESRQFLSFPRGSARFK